MEKENIISRAQEVLSPFETENVVKFLKELSVTTIFDNPVILVLLVVVFFFAVFKRSKFVLLFLFTLLSLTALVHYALPMGADMTAPGLPSLCLRLPGHWRGAYLFHLYQGGLII